MGQGHYTMRSVSDCVYPSKVIIMLGYLHGTLKQSKYRIYRTFCQNIGQYRTTSEIWNL